MNKYFNWRVEFYHEISIEKIKKELKEDWMKLRVEVHDVITKIKEYNETNKKEQSLPDKFVQELLKIFCEELER